MKRHQERSNAIPFLLSGFRIGVHLASCSTDNCENLEDISTDIYELKLIDGTRGVAKWGGTKQQNHPRICRLHSELHSSIEATVAFLGQQSLL